MINELNRPFMLACVVFFLQSCMSSSDTSGQPVLSKDVHSFARPEQVVVRHLELDLEVDFKSKVLKGRASLEIENRNGTRELSLDSKDLQIERITLDGGGMETSFLKGESIPFLGEPLSIRIEPDTTWVHIDYQTSPGAAALQWLDPEQTTGKRHPFLLSQSQAILARSWVPCQDTPAVRMTYSASIQVPPGLMAVMSASNPKQLNLDGRYRFEMPQAIPSYLLAIAVGDLRFEPIGKRSGVYAEPSVIKDAVWELADTEKMLRAAEDLYGAYRWDRYDMIILPPSFPFGGMENPRLTFLTPTILTRDRSLVSLIAHELAHSWSGNLVTNKTWNDFWLNEGFTTYFEHRIMEAVYGTQVELLLAELELQKLTDSIEEDFSDTARDTWLKLDLIGRDPDDAMTAIAYDKGHFFLRMLETHFGRNRWDEFLMHYFETFAFQSIDTSTFLDFLRRELLEDDKELEDSLKINAWVFGPGLPSNHPNPRSEALSQVRSQLLAFSSGTGARSLDVLGWRTHQYLYFLRNLPKEMTLDRIADLDRVFGFTNSGNAEILHEWLMLTIANDYRDADLALEVFLRSQGRRKFVVPLYGALTRTSGGLLKARKIYAKCRSLYHSVTREAIDALLDSSQDLEPEIPPERSIPIAST